MNNNFLPYQLKKTNDTNEALATQLAEKANQTDIQPRPVILITDWWTDVDDVMGARILCWAERSGMVDIVGVVSSCANGQIIPSIDAFFEAEGRQGIPMAVDKNAGAFGFGGATPPYQANMMPFRHSYTSESSAESDITFFRRALANTKTPIDIISIGYLNNLSNLLNSPADTISSLTGNQLVQQKVNHLWVMGGQYPSGSENNFNRNSYAISSAYNVVTNWPTPITFSGYEVGGNIIAGDTVQTIWPAADDLLTQAITDYNTAGSLPAGSGRNSWDPVTVLLACYGDPYIAGYTSVYGTNTIDQVTGANTFLPNNTGKHRYVVKQRTNNWFKINLNNILNKTNWPSRKDIGGQQLIKPDLTANIVDKTNLLSWYHADDLIANPDGATVYHLEDRLRNTHFRAVSGERPIYKNNIGLKSAVSLSGTTRMATDNFTSQPSMTIYAKVWWDTLPTSAQSILGQDAGAGYTRLWHLKATTASNIQGVGFNGTTGNTDNKAGALSSGTWYALTMVLTPTSIETFVNGVSDGKTTVTGMNIGTVPISLGCRSFTGTITEGFIGYFREGRIYSGAHDSATISSVISQMS